MDLRITDDQAALAAGVRAFFEAELPPPRLRMRTEGGADDSALWQAYVAMGLSGLCAPERLGGLGMGALEAALVAIECGRACAPGALVDTGLTAAPLLAARGEDARGGEEHAQALQFRDLAEKADARRARRAG